MRFLRSLYVQVLIAIAIGILLGYFVPDFAVSLKPLGDAFIKLIKMIIAPIIFCTVVLGIAGMENLKSVGRTGAYALVYFEVLSTIALMIGLVVVNVVQPGGGMNIDPATLNAGAVAQFAGPGDDTDCHAVSARHHSGYHGRRVCARRYSSRAFCRDP